MSSCIVSSSILINAPIERCFLLSASIDLHMESAVHTHERAIAGVTHGLIGPGETVTWRGRHCGLMLTHESRITAYDPPRHFRDEMVHGLFRSFVHDHFFTSTPEGTLMRDELRFSAPLGILGQIAEALVLRRHLTRFLMRRNAVLRSIAESKEQWQRYLATD